MNEPKLHVLIVEDHKLAQKIATMVVASFGCQVDTADNGADAIIQFEKNNYDLIFIDLGLPDTDGFNVTQELRKREIKKQKQSVIVALTAHIEESFRKDAFSAGMNDFLTKPLTTDKVRNIFGNLLNLKQ